MKEYLQRDSCFRGNCWCQSHPTYGPVLVYVLHTYSTPSNPLSRPARSSEITHRSYMLWDYIMDKLGELDAFYCMSSRDGTCDIGGTLIESLNELPTYIYTQHTDACSICMVHACSWSLQQMCPRCMMCGVLHDHFTRLATTPQAHRHPSATTIHSGVTPVGRLARCHAAVGMHTRDWATCPAAAAHWQLPLRQACPRPARFLPSTIQHVDPPPSTAQRWTHESPRWRCQKHAASVHGGREASKK